MNKLTYRVMFDNGNTVTFESTVNVDFHRIGVSEYGAGSMAFDDIFINLQHVVFIDKEEKVEETSMEKCCATCKYKINPVTEEPCFSCVFEDNFSKWEAKKGVCNTCKYETNPIPAEPCFSCIHGLCDENTNRTEKWEAKDNGTNNT